MREGLQRCNIHMCYRQTAFQKAVIAVVMHRGMSLSVIMSVTKVHLYQLALLRSATCWHNPWHNLCRGASLAVRGGQARGPLTLAGGPVTPRGTGLGPPWGQAAGIGLSLVPA